MSERRQFRDGVRATQEEEPEADPKADKGAKKDDKGKGKGKKDEPEEEELPLLQEKRDLTTKMFQTTEHYQNEWEDFNEEDNFAQKHDVELVKNEIRDGNLEVWVWILMGVGHFLGLRYGLWAKNGLGDTELDAVMDFIRNGIAVSDSNRS